jgi:NitT/TauT family transport system ATP-binding protein
MINLFQITKNMPVVGLVLDQITLTIKPGRITALIGSNGCGKSTLARILAGIDRQDHGEIEGIDSGSVALVPQDYRASLLPWLSIEANILLPLKLRGVSRFSQAVKLKKILNRIPVGHLLSRKTWELSGGQAQLICMARALIAKPKLLILDEPFSALDVIMSDELGKTLSKLVTSSDLSILLISHNIDHTIELSEHICVMGSHPGRIIYEVETNKKNPNSKLDKIFLTSSRIVDLIAADNLQNAA